MIRVLAIAGLTWRTTIRSRVFALLLALVTLGILGLPFVLQSDGTAAGEVRLYLRYALGLTVFLLSLAALWSGAGAIALEVERRQMHLVVVKPVRAAHIWCGKWLGLMAVNACLVAWAGVLTQGGLSWTLRAGRFTEAQRAEVQADILTARERRLPLRETPRVVAQRLIAARAPDAAPLTLEAAEAALAREAETGRIGVPSGARREWRFRLPDDGRPGAAVFVAFRFDSSQALNWAPMRLEWRMGPADQPDRCRVPLAAAPRKAHRFRVPPEALAADRPWVLSCVNTETAAPATLLFAEREGVSVWVQRGGFVPNAGRALLTVWIRLAFFTALGLTAGALFSFPVAVFASFAYLVFSGFDRFIAEMARGGAARDPLLVASGWSAALGWACDVLRWIVPPLSRFDALDRLGDGAWVTWGFVGQAAMGLLGGYGVALAGIGIVLFARRELGAAGEAG